MKRYSEFQPTGFDCKGLGIPDKQHWLVVPVSQTRDSETLERCNFDSAIAILGGEHELCEVHRFGHWGPGWFEIIIIHPALERFAERNIIEPLEDYPILDEEKFSEMELEEREEDWEDWFGSDCRKEFREHYAEKCNDFFCELLAPDQIELCETIDFFIDLEFVAENIAEDSDDIYSGLYDYAMRESSDCFTGRFCEQIARDVFNDLNSGDDLVWQAINSAVAEFLVPRMRQHDMRFARIILDIYDNDTYRNESTIEAESLLRFAEREGADCA